MSVQKSNQSFNYEYYQKYIIMLLYNMYGITHIYSSLYIFSYYHHVSINTNNHLNIRKVNVLPNCDLLNHINLSLHNRSTCNLSNTLFSFCNIAQYYKLPLITRMSYKCNINITQYKTYIENIHKLVRSVYVKGL